MFFGNFYESGHLYCFVVHNLQTKISERLLLHLILRLNVLYKVYELPALINHNWSIHVIRYRYFFKEYSLGEGEGGGLINSPSVKRGGLLERGAY